MSAPTRSCGTCTLCCKVMRIPELDKPGGVWCPHATPGKGCGIYGSHPASCKVFHCQWIYQPGLPEAFRPDRSKVVLDVVGDGAQLKFMAVCDPGAPDAWRREPMYSFLKREARVNWGRGRVVIAQAGRRYWLLTPTEDLDLGEIDATTDFSLKAKVVGGKTIFEVVTRPAAATTPAKPA